MWLKRWQHYQFVGTLGCLTRIKLKSNNCLHYPKKEAKSVHVLLKLVSTYICFLLTYSMKELNNVKSNRK